MYGVFDHREINIVVPVIEKHFWGTPDGRTGFPWGTPRPPPRLFLSTDTTGAVF